MATGWSSHKHLKSMQMTGGHDSGPPPRERGGQEAEPEGGRFPWPTESLRRYLIFVRPQQAAFSGRDCQVLVPAGHLLASVY